jgi:hypothetical protein
MMQQTEPADFPVAIGVHEVPDPRALGLLIAGELTGTPAVPGVSVDDWLPAALMGFDAAVQRAVVKSLLRQRHPGAIRVGCAVALACQPDGVGPYLVSALVEHDVGLLMQDDGAGQFVEERLARTAAAICPLEQPAWRENVLTVLRSCGATADEARVLHRYGTPAEVRSWAVSMGVHPEAEPGSDEELALLQEALQSVAAP